jgi:hypothetical protein
MSDPKKYLGEMIAQAQDYDRRGDAAMRDYTVSRLLSDDCGLTIRYIRAALRAAGLIR